MTYFSVVRANVAPGAGARQEEFVRWWADEHQTEYVAMPGFHRAWLLERVEHPHAHGDQEQTYTAVYEVDEIEDFHAALEAGPPWGPWQPYVDDWLIDWGRTYREVMACKRSDDGAGQYWALVAADFDLTANELAQFRAWYDERHLTDLLAHRGIRCASRLELAPHGGDLGPRGRWSWALYEVDTPDAFANARHARAADGIEPWDGLWGDHLHDWSISFHRIINRIERSRDDNRV